MSREPDADEIEAPPTRVPREPLGRLFLRFLRFGALAWGGPIAQIAMIRRELVEEERWVSPERFNRTLAIYQVLPGPEAHELCVHFGMLSRGRLGGVLAGLGFMLPGFLLVLAASALYVADGLQHPLVRAAFLGFQAAVVGVVLRATLKIADHVLTGLTLAALAVAALLLQLLGVHFAITLAACGLAAIAAGRGRAVSGRRIFVVALAVVVAASAFVAADPAVVGDAAAPGERPSIARVFASGLEAGLLTFGGAYTAIPFLENDAVGRGWLTGAQFLDGLALTGVLPTPLIMFGTFVGHLAAGLAGALAMTAGIFLPAFGMTLVGHSALERLVEHPRLRRLLDGVAAGVVGLIGATCVSLLRQVLVSPAAALVVVLAFVVLLAWKARSAVAFVVLGGGLLGVLLMRA